LLPVVKEEKIVGLTAFIDIVKNWQAGFKPVERDARIGSSTLT
jgi:hypothetical protein